ncbi:hypothetical protein BD324DRAFT_649715 [Kockovaella imperatae]|uniref:F-box domain-containing protein n=1 Tax=Kockovaella imperatae TaxID=4999 RepID=A0A1Y1UJV1_9TREE|nr:hypothetical protein BD324DRAFT_649715 [Kockovaella imperatae]ORX38340.1 hypothetical protein BD324DRAFT_649715 [Kockovaella imperatae]
MLDRLPFEILAAILDGLSSQDLTHLSLTDRCLSEHAEVKLFSSVRLCSSGLERDVDLSVGYRRPCGLIKKLVQYPIKASHIRKLELVISPQDLDSRVAMLLRGCGRHLRELELSVTLGPVEVKVLNTILDENTSDLPQLTHLSLPLSLLGTSLCRDLLKKTPRLRHLILKRIKSSYLTNSDVGQSPSQNMASTRLKIVCITELTFLDYESVSNLFTTSKSIERLEITSGLAVNDTPPWRELTEKIRQLPSLSHLTVELGRPWRWETGGFNQLRDLTLQRRYDGCYVPSLQDLAIPPLPNLEILRFVNTRQTSSNPYFCCQHSRQSTPPAIQTVEIPSSILGNIRMAPRLHRIELHTVLPRLNLGCWTESPEMMEEAVVECIRIRSVSTPGRFEPIFWCRNDSHVLLRTDGTVRHLKDRVAQDWISIAGQSAKQRVEILPDRISVSAWIKDERQVIVPMDVWELPSG